ncbi:MAG: hypothetical protein JWQ29_1368 [Phenylobacterium sp.]|nr:hypothetical protein [Phenylobacterium sp.]
MDRRKPTPHLSRRGVAIGLVLLAGPAAVRAAPCAPPTVLFVCPAGTVKSAIARETLKRRAAQAGVAVRVASRGVHPEAHVSPALKASLLADGIDPAAEPLRALEPQDLARADIVIAFDEAAQAPGLQSARVWDVPSWNSQYPEAKAAMAPKIDALLAELARRPCRRP